MSDVYLVQTPPFDVCWLGRCYSRFEVVFLEELSYWMSYVIPLTKIPVSHDYMITSIIDEWGQGIYESC